MLARRHAPDDFVRWNRAHGAPFGAQLRAEGLLGRLLPRSVLTRLRGPFSIQPNNNTRAFEYPWAFHAAEPRPGLDVLEIGGGLSGFQFVLSRLGCRVVNVDPGMEATGVGWPCDAASMRRLNGLFGTTVELRNTVLEAAGLADESFDLVFSISVLEHLPEHEIANAVREAFRVLRPGGRLVMTVDLFLNIRPFTTEERNRYGTNVDLRWLLDQAPFELEQGTPAELYGFDEFSAERVLARLDELLVGDYPAAAQCLVLRKP
ncbi:MAG TPA: class I SAM-dependent methyltransferase [Longimicrobiaceae bacterium]|nr:class I SAM-dependent methyltransferase [Longimicrobiaceae bacterium]